MSNSSVVQLRRLESRDDPLFLRAVEAVCLAFHNEKHTVVSIPSMVGGRFELLAVIVAGMIGACMTDGNVHFAAEAREDGGEEVLGVICWVGPGQEIKLEEDLDWQRYIQQGRKDPVWGDWYDEILKKSTSKLAASTLPGGAHTLNRYCIEALGVHPAHRRRGIGSKLINTVIEAARGHPNPDCAIVWVITSEGTAAYESCGLKVTYSIYIPSPWGDFTYLSLAWKKEQGGLK
ncbi:hypothetical protein M422DRAFT_66878 [Sphaerobolus stellatus SS14]|uniref:N-acetyltransferase domain-containing protein n=1 Tax=Sphaerobolus stellatus (strain SS14) TaxID=990650 RepID=A0A0C9VGE8_SPHS4|nr:hypothetical protein M422DRAFT_66878 [Sphaerobolus stellatus SS14]